MLVVGSANMDLVFQVERFPQPGETILGGPFQTFPGGKGANQAVAVGRLGGNVEFVGCLGHDFFADELLASLHDAGVGSKFTWNSTSAETGTAAILVNAQAQNMIVVAGGANELVSDVQVEQAIRESGAEIVLAQLEIPEAAVAAASRAPRFILNPAPARLLPDEILGNVEVITPNEIEAEIITGIAVSDVVSCERAAAWLLEKGVQNVVITLGARGAFWTDGTNQAMIPAFPVEAVDTVAAGDAFSGALAHFLAEGRPMIEALTWASATAALSTMRHGAQASMPTLDEVAALMASRGA
jgi:ribokinase